MTDFKEEEELKIERIETEIQKLQKEIEAAEELDKQYDMANGKNLGSLYEEKFNYDHDGEVSIRITFNSNGASISIKRE